MQPPPPTLHIKRGDTLVPMACTLQINGVPVDITGWRVSCWLRSPNAKLVAKLSTTVTNAAAGQYNMPATPLDTIAWPEALLKADIRYVDAAGRVMHTDTQSAANATQLGQMASRHMGLRNMVINGDFAIDQYGLGLNTAVTVSTGKSYLIDRWNVQCTKQFRLQVRDDTAQFSRYLRLTQNAGAVTMAAADYAMVSQIVEVAGLLDYLRWGWSTTAKPLTVSFWVRCGSTGTFAFTARVYTGSKYLVFPGTFTITAGGTWERKTITIPAPTPAMAGSAGIGAYLELDFDLGSGSSVQTATTGAWLDTGAATYRRATAGTNLMAKAAWSLDLTEVQLEEGDAATPFERRPATIERQLCERYYQTVYVGKVVAVIYTPNGDTRAEGINLPTPMRAVSEIKPATVVNHSINFTASAEGVNAPWLIGLQVAEPAPAAAPAAAETKKAKD